MAGCRAVRVPTDERYQLSTRRDRARDHQPHARHRHDLAEQPERRGVREASLRAVNALCRDRGLYHIADEPYEYFTYGSARHVSPGSFAGR